MKVPFAPFLYKREKMQMSYVNHTLSLRKKVLRIKPILQCKKLKAFFFFFCVGVLMIQKCFVDDASSDELSSSRLNMTSPVCFPPTQMNLLKVCVC